MSCLVAGAPVVISSRKSPASKSKVPFSHDIARADLSAYTFRGMTTPFSSLKLCIPNKSLVSMLARISRAVRRLDLDLRDYRGFEAR